MMEVLSDSKVIKRSNGIILSEVHLSESAFVSILTVDRSHVRNALDPKAIKVLHKFTLELSHQPAQHRMAVILNGAGGALFQAET